LSVYVFSVYSVDAVQQSEDVGTEESHTTYSTPLETASSRDIYRAKTGLNTNENINIIHLSLAGY